MVILAKGFQPTQPEVQVVNKGLTFIPTVKIHKGQKSQMMVDVQDYHMRVKLSTYFKRKINEEPIPFIPKSNWTPKLSALPPSIRSLVRADTCATKTFNWTVRDKTNLSSEEAQALTQLKHNNHVIIKPADKGSAVVILDRDQYIWEAKRQFKSL